MTDEQLKAEMMEDMKEEARLDWQLANDYEYFLEFYAEDVNELTIAYYRMRELARKHGYTFTTEDMKDLM